MRPTEKQLRELPFWSLYNVAVQSTDGTEVGGEPLSIPDDNMDPKEVTNRMIEYIAAHGDEPVTRAYNNTVLQLGWKTIED